MSSTPQLLSLREVAERLDVKHETARSYHQQAARRRRQNQPRPGDMPEPDVVVERTPAWYSTTIDRWERPGPGVGGGRPRKSTAGGQ